MVKMLCLPKKNKKGFTLIELIVVIAILAILAVIAIPRFAGFTEKAKVANDEQYAALVANSVMVLVASGDLNYGGGDVVIKITPTGKVLSFTGASTGAPAKLADATAFNAALVKLVAEKPVQSTTYKDGLTVTASDSGVKKVVAEANPDAVVPET